MGFSQNLLSYFALMLGRQILGTCHVRYRKEKSGNMHISELKGRYGEWTKKEYEVGLIKRGSEAKK